MNLIKGIPQNEDKYKDMEYPPPKKYWNSEVFCRVWCEYVGSVASRSNFSKGHLNQLVTLCELHQEAEDLQDYITVHKRTYESHGRNGVQIKLRPEVAHVMTIRREITIYNKLLGLVLDKDLGDSSEADSEWS